MIERALDPGAAAGPPPDGATAEVTGVPVVLAESLDRLSGERYILLLVSLVAVAAVLLVAGRSLSRMLSVMLPVLIAVGWSALLLATIGLPLNPLSAVLSVMVVAVSTDGDRRANGIRVTARRPSPASPPGTIEPSSSGGSSARPIRTPAASKSAAVTGTKSGIDGPGQSSAPRQLSTGWPFSPLRRYPASVRISERTAASHSTTAGSVTSSARTTRSTSPELPVASSAAR
ncbi:MAG: MMPL family transporter [Solirubrobacterales bacterium]